VFHVSTSGVSGLAVCPWENYDDDDGDEGSSLDFDIELGRIPPEHGLLHSSIQRRMKSCQRNLNGNLVMVLDSELVGLEGRVVPNCSCQHFKNYFAQPNCHWNLWHFVIATLEIEFNFTRASIYDSRKMWSGVCIPLQLSVMEREVDAPTLLADLVEKKLFIQYRELKEDVRRESMSFKFWFKPFDLSTWILIIRSVHTAIYRE